MAFSDQFLDELRGRAGLVEVISRVVKLTRKGREYQGLCPFHKEKTPSFTVNEDKGFYHCFGCQAHGSVFDFIMETENLSFPDAVEKLASDIGMEVPRDTPQERERQKKLATLLDVVELATCYFERVLRLPEGKSGLDYLYNRGLSDDTITRFRIGFAPEGRNSLIAALARENVGEELMLAAGLVINPNENINPSGPSRNNYDRFRSRVMFPISNQRGYVVGFGGRIIRDGQPKYLNSPETPLFQKRQILFGLDLATPNARKNNSLIVAEGYMDVIALVQAGYPNVVAPLGTALTNSQIQMLWKVTREPVLCFDGDAAGQRAAAKAAERALPLLKPGYGLRFASLPEGQDPDDLIKARGAEAIQAVLNEAQPVSELLWQIETGGRLPSSAEDRAALESRLKNHARCVQDSTVRTHFTRVFSERLWPDGHPSATRKKNWNKSIRRSSGTSPNIHSADANMVRQLNTAEIRRTALLASLINHPGCFDEMGEAIGTIAFSAPELDNLRQQVLNTLVGNPELDSAGLITQLNDSGIADTVSRVLSTETYRHGFFARPGTERHEVLSGWRDALRLFRDENLAREIEEAKRASQENPSEEASRRLQILTRQKLALQMEDEVYTEA
ncbi:MAG: DNA primase [Rhodospirillaceae bacterium TMED8]|nr:DNA primase [Magnetovibrio sp.]OUT48567.1 MAG: DNA primase [Rhodospirillaceae bacterium TMED8]